MIRKLRSFCGCLSMAASFFFLLAARAQNVVIHEIMYHPASQSPRDEWIELRNLSPTNVNLTGWTLAGGVDFVFPTNTIIPAGGYLVVAAQKASFQASHPLVANVVGDFVRLHLNTVAGYSITNWDNTLSNTRNAIELKNAAGNTLDRVEYADEGDWAQRQRGLNDAGHRGWKWSALHDGFGRSLELINATMPNEYGQNWTSSSVVGGSPGMANSTNSPNIAPLILDVAHFPAVPRSTNPVSVAARILNETSAGVSARLYWRVDAATPSAFQQATMFDDGAHEDGLANDGTFAASIPAQANNAVVEFYVYATDAQGNARTWPAGALPAPDDPTGSPTNAANALFQVDDTPQNEFVAPGQPILKLILTEAERAEMAGIPCSGSQNSDAEMNVTFISRDGQGTEVRYQASVRNRGNSSRCANPPNYRLGFPSDKPWRDISSLNLNSVQVYLQHFGSTLAIKSGAVGAYSRAVKLRVNNADLARSGSPMFGSYAANEVINSEWAENHFPSDGGGNAYRAQRNIDPSEFDYRGENPNSYRNTYYKESNVSEDDWRDLIVMHNVMGLNGTVPFAEGNVRQAINPEQWLTHLAVMALMNNSESGLNSGHNDDYYMYRGVNDPRFILVFHDLDQLFDLGGNPFGTSDTVFGAAFIQSNNQGGRSTPDNDGSGNMMNRFLHSPEFAPLYYATLQRLLDTTFSKPQFDALLDQTLGSYAPGTISAIRNWMDARRAYVQSIISPFVPAKFIPPVATISGEPRNPSPSRNASLTVGGVGISHYMFQLNGGGFGPETPVSTPILLSNLPQGSTNIVYVVGKSTNGTWQSTGASTASQLWVVNTSTPTVRLNEVLASNNGAVIHSGSTPDVVELFNDGTAAVDLAGLRLTNDKDVPSKFTFPMGTILEPAAFLTVYANNADGTPGLHTGFTLDADGDQLYLFDRVANGNGILDSVRFGIQITDHSIGRVGSGSTWFLAAPSFGSGNIAQPLAGDSNLKINEWLADGGAQADFLELYNPDSRPVALGGLFLTDEPLDAAALHRIANLSFVPANGFVWFTADGNANKPSHVNFRLTTDAGEIALLSAIGQPIDSVIYGPQAVGISMGRCPDGGVTNRFLSLATPGSRNVCPAAPPGVITSRFMEFAHAFSYEQSGTDLGTAWIDPGYDDSGWPVGRGFFGTPTQGGGTTPWGPPVNTIFTAGGGRTTFYLRTKFTNNLSSVSALQLEHITDDGAIFYLNGVEFYRYNMPAGAVSFSTPSAANINPTVSSGPITLPATLLRSGVNSVAVELHQSPSSTVDIGIGFTLDAIIATNSAASAGVVINEVLADNASWMEGAGRTPDWVEIYNPSSDAVDLSDMSVSDEAASPRRWIFPSGSIISAKGYFQLRFDADLPASSTNTGWGLKATGDSVFLFNRLADGGGLRDAITFGLQVADFSIARMPSGSTNWNLSVPSLGSPNLAVTLGNPALLRINEWMANPAPGEDDFIELYNPTAQPIALGGLWLTDTLTQRDKHRIADLSFIGALTNAWRVFKADGNTVLGADHVGFSLRAAGEDVGLSWPDLRLIDGISFTNQLEGISGGRLPDGGNQIVNFGTTASPGNANFLPVPGVVINEALAHSDAPLEDAIELRNLTGTNINLGGWWLSDSRGDPRRFLIPAGTILGANGFRVFYENQFNSVDTALVPFSLSSAKGDEIYLSATDANGALTGYRAFAEFPASENGVSFGRHSNSVGTVDFTAMSVRSFGVDNPVSLQSFRTGMGLGNPYPKVGPIVFSEIMFQPPLLQVTNDNTRDEFVELRNITGGPVPLYDPNYSTNRWRVRGGVDFDFPPGATLGPAASLIIVGFDPAADPASLAAFKATYGISGTLPIYGPWSGKLSNGGESISLLKPDSVQLAPSPDAGSVPYIVVDKLVYTNGSPWPAMANATGRSLQRVSITGYANDPTNWFAATPTLPPSGSGDADSDGMPDSWEQMHSLNSNSSADANQDVDGDGMTNLQEYLGGTNPRNPGSVLKVAVSLSQTAAVLQFEAVANLSYTIRYRTSLSTGLWLNLSNISAAPFDRTIRITNNGSTTQRFYQVVTP